MSFAIFKGETSVKELVSRLFGISGKGSAAKADAAAKALVQANPQLQNINKVPVGTVITVPPGAPPLKPAEAAPAAVASPIAIATQAQQTLNMINQRLADMDARAADAANAFLALVESDQVQTLVQKLPQVKQQLPTLIADTLTVVTATKANQALRAQAITNVHTALQAFAQRKG